MLTDFRANISVPHQEFLIILQMLIRALNIFYRKNLLFSLIPSPYCPDNLASLVMRMMNKDKIYSCQYFQSRLGREVF